MTGILPKAVSYAIPTLTEPNVARWELSPGRSALLVHDMQEYFLRSFDRSAEPFTTVIPAIAAVLAAARQAGVPVYFTAQPGNQDPQERALLTDFWGPGLGAGPRNEAIVDAVRPAPGEQILTKWRYSAFAKTPLRQLLSSVGRDQLVIVGVYAHIGVLATALDGFMQDIQPFVVADAIADFTASDHLWALSYSARRCAKVVRAAEVEAAWKPQAPVTERNVNVVPSTSSNGSRLAREQAWRDWLFAQTAAALGVSPGEVTAGTHLFDSGLDSMRAIALLERLDLAGVEVDFVEFVSDGRLGFLLEQAIAAGGDAPAADASAAPAADS